MRLLNNDNQCMQQDAKELLVWHTFTTAVPIALTEGAKHYMM